MSKKDRKEDRELDGLILGALKRAIEGQRMDVAEHLLVALELLGSKAAEEGEDLPAEPGLAEAYGMMPKSAKPPSR